MRCRELLKEGERALLAAGVPEGGLDAWYLFSHCFSMDRGTYFRCMETEIPEGGKEAEREFRRLIGRRAGRIPLQQLLGSQEFMGFVFFVNEHVLIPRQDTETLAETVLEKERGAAGPYRLLDLCTGSGCIGISLAVCMQQRGAFGDGAQETGEPWVVLSDISPEALLVAAENVRRFGLGEACRLVESDLFEALPGERFDCIVSNPPYIPSEEIERLMPEVRDHEPRLALDGSGDGLAFYRRIREEAADHLLPGGRLYLEIGWDQGETVPELFRAAGFLQVEVFKDLAGNDRVVRAVRPE